MKKIFVSLIISVLFIIAFSGCKDECKGKDTSPQTITYPVEEDAKAKFPFKDKDTQIYISNLGDTAILFGRLYSGYERSSNQKLDNECFKPITTQAEQLSYYATGSNPELNKIEFILRAQFEEPVGENEINFRINGNIPKIGMYGYFYLSPEYLNNVNGYTDSIMVNGTYLYGKPLIEPNLISFLYNFQYGFLKIEFSSGKIWTKIN
jgi:hypothetical protein